MSVTLNQGWCNDAMKQSNLINLPLNTVYSLTLLDGLLLQDKSTNKRKEIKEGKGK